MTSRTTDGITDPVYRPVDGGVVEITRTRKKGGTADGAEDADDAGE